MNDSEGGTHFHINTSLLGSDGDNDRAPSGDIYLTETALLKSALTGIASDTVFVRLNNGLAESLHETSREYAETTPVPEPTSAVLLAPIGVVEIFILGWLVEAVIAVRYNVTWDRQGQMRHEKDGLGTPRYTSVV